MINQSSRLAPPRRALQYPLAAIWPVDFHDAFTQSGLHRVLSAKTQRLVSAERDGYFGLSRITKSSWINSAIRTNRSGGTWMPQSQHRTVVYTSWSTTRGQQFVSGHSGETVFLTLPRGKPLQLSTKCSIAKNGLAFSPTNATT